MSVFLYSVFVVSCAQVAALRQADPPFKETYRLCKKIKKVKKSVKVQQRAVKKLLISELSATYLKAESFDIVFICQDGSKLKTHVSLKKVPSVYIYKDL
jgi:hypothetical protein